MIYKALSEWLGVLTAMRTCTAEQWDMMSQTLAGLSQVHMKLPKSKHMLRLPT